VRATTRFPSEESLASDLLLVIYLTNREDRRMPTYNIAELKAHLSNLVNRALAGEEVIVARDNRPLLKLVPIESPPAKRKPGSARNLVKVAADFDATPPDLVEYTR
jgi:prevent-host-death family protein